MSEGCQMVNGHKSLASNKLVITGKTCMKPVHLEILTLSRLIFSSFLSQIYLSQL